MKGIIFKQFEAFISENFGAVVYEEILDKAPVDQDEPFLGPETYPDEDLYAMLGIAVESLGIPTEDALLAFGEYLYNGLAKSLPMCQQKTGSLKELLMSIHSVIHIEVKKLLPGAETPEFAFEDPAPDRLVLRYQSKRNLCSLARGLLQGASNAYGEEIEVTKTTCTKDGSPHCEFDILFVSQARKAG